MGFSGADYAVLVLYLAGITAFGARFRRSHRTVRDYFVGARNTPWIVISLSIVATETSTLTLIGVPAIAYAAGGNLTYLQVVAGYVVARVIISLLLVPAYFQGDLLTAYTLLERRFGVRARHFAASLFLAMRPLADGVRIFATSLVISAVLAASLPSLPHLWLWSILGVGALTLAYTFEGGLAAVVWTDLVQLIVYIAGSLLAAYELLTLIPGGWPTVMSHAQAAGKLRVFSFSWDLTQPFTFWSGLIGGTFLTMASHGTDQLLVQRLLACRNQRDSQKALITSGFLVFAQFALFLFIGIMLFVHYQFAGEPAMTTTDEVFPAFIVRSLPHGVAGLVIAAILSAAMSTLSGALNSLASTTIVDFYRPIAGGRASEEALLRLSRWCTVAWGTVLMAIAVVAKDWGSVFTAGLTIASIVYGPMLGAFLLGTLTTRANQAGVMAGMAVSLACTVALKVWTPLAWTWFVLAGTLICMAVGYAVSRLAQARGSKLEARDGAR